ncbi:hypothetical protein H8356DRAFT_1435123 [Neocallimastix lanati (nom. inval.)]|nr:hypothetical protein H8356DRAFT_1435123 [Neocallimastix sp. JGI-2020a]
MKDILLKNHSQLFVPDGIPTEFFKAFSILRIASLLRMILTKSNSVEVPNALRISGSNTKNDYFYFLIKFGMVINELNSASIVSVIENGDLSDCNNHFRLILDYAFSHGIIRPEQFGFKRKKNVLV